MHVDLGLIGLGHVGQQVLRILETRGDRLQRRYGVHLRVVCVADSSGVAVNPAGYDPAEVRHWKEAGGQVAGLTGFRPGQRPAQALVEGPCQMVLEATPVNLQDGEPGLGVVRSALAQGIHVVLANKGPLVLAYQELHRLAAAHGAGLAFSATVCGGLPVINTGQRDLIGAEILALRGIFNSTSNFILSEMAAGRAFDEALAEAQRRGIAEADPSLDVEGWDTANKLVILANSVLGIPATLQEISVTGITGITTQDLEQSQRRDRTIKLVAQAIREETGYRLSVMPMELDQDEFLAQCQSWEMGIEIQTDLYGTLYQKIWEQDPLPTAAAMIRDAVHLSQQFISRA
ncbi:homoserine dehydrogenase [Litorilinea aerophila]|uniref:Homoserine dehydrogenase n=1 Tax=Litorilinea aerophila TaxID=1204385 RepID=A0A540VML4_9CHLR|nr:homoserine dehydrogenase [Litorilinea aerophila]MCC9074712.1 homoserine dehydrogenase [Litorilinea aerophila]